MDIEHHNYWEENSNTQLLKYENCNSNDGVANPAHQQPKDDTLFRCCDSNLNFATVACSEDDSEFSHYKKNKVSRQDPMSHRIIEKRRRDRMNNCLADLSRLIPADYLKKGRGRIEKTEIIEMAIRHIKYLQQSHRHAGREDTSTERGFNHEQYRLGYQECMSETMRFLVEVEGYFAREALCVRLINHLQKHCDDLLQERIQNTSISSEKDYSHMQSVSNLISPNINLNNNPVIRLQSPRQEHYENNSHLKDMLTGNIKDEINDHFIMNRQTRSDVDISISDEKNYNKNEYDYHKLQEHKKDEQLLKAELTDNHREYTNGASLYKFKNNIKQRFSQDLTAETNQQKIFKRRKLSEPIRRNSLTTETYSSENHSSPMDGSQCSPPGSEFRISSESENARISPTGSSVSDNRNSDRNRYVNLKPETNLNKPVNGFGRYSPVNKYPIKNTPVTPTIETDKTNFSVPIFALHAKGSFYIPLTIDYHTLVPYLQHNSVLDILPNVHNIILHPVTINVNFQSNYFNSINVRSIRPNKNKVEGQNGWH